MKLLFTFICAIALSTVVASAQTSSTTTTTAASTTSTENVGTVTDFTPGATIVISSGTGEPVHYKLGKSVTYINAKGKEIKADRIRKDRKVRVHYMKEGNDMVVDKVTVVKD